MIPSFKIEYVN